MLVKKLLSSKKSFRIIEKKERQRSLLEYINNRYSMVIISPRVILIIEWVWGDNRKSVVLLFTRKLLIIC